MRLRPARATPVYRFEQKENKKTQNLKTRIKNKKLRKQK
jgi:hypothetical protein